MHALFDIYKVDPRGSAMWMGSVQSYSVALFEIELIAVNAPGDYAIVNRQTGERTALSCGLKVWANDVNPSSKKERVTRSWTREKCQPVTSPVFTICACLPTAVATQWCSVHAGLCRTCSRCPRSV
jgi:hypothetical protein